MKKYLLGVLLFNLMIISLDAQVKFGINVGVGLSTPQILKERPNEDYAIAGVVTPVFGVYPQVKWKNIILETGVETSQSKMKGISRYEFDKSLSIHIERSAISRLSIPMVIGYNIKLGSFGITPMIGIIRNMRTGTVSSFTNIYKEGGNSYSEKSSNPYHNYSNSNKLNKNRLLARIDFNLTDRFSLGTSVIFRRTENHSYFDCCFGDCYYEYYSGVKYKRDYRFFAMYRL